jgi:hypothetical protein
LSGRSEAPVAVWDREPVEMSANDWWFSAKGLASSAEPKRALDVAISFLKEFLKGGPKLNVEVMTAANERGIRKGTLHGARLALKLVVAKQGGVPHGPWMWSLPDQPKTKVEVVKPLKSKKSRKPGTNIIPLFPKRGGGGDAA